MLMPNSEVDRLRLSVRAVIMDNASTQQAHMAVVVECADGPATIALVPLPSFQGPHIPRLHLTKRAVLQAAIDTSLPQLASLAMKDPG